MDWKKLTFGEASMVSETNVVVPGLTTDSKYHFRVIAVNTIGAGPPSMPSRRVLVKDMIGRLFIYLLSIIGWNRFFKTFFTPLFILLALSVTR